jgi:hypothetical protein
MKTNCKCSYYEIRNKVGQWYENVNGVSEMMMTQNCFCQTYLFYEERQSYDIKMSICVHVCVHMRVSHESIPN